MTNQTLKKLEEVIETSQVKTCTPVSIYELANIILYEEKEKGGVLLRLM